MLEIFYADIRDINDGELNLAFDEFPQLIKSKINAKTHLISKKQSIVGYNLLKNGVKKLFNRGIEHIYFSENGKPLLSFCYFSISHSENAVVCAISDLPVGVDIQKIMDIPVREQYPIFSQEESDFVNQIPNLQQKRFFEIFTKKEALVKLCGNKLSECNSLDISNIKFEILEKSKYIFCIAAFEK